MGNQSSKPDLGDLAQETQLDHDEMKQLLKVFNSMAGKDGIVTKEDFKEAVRQSLGTSDPSFAAALYNMFDKDGSKGIDAKEFILAFAYLSNKSLDDVVETSFRVFDLNNDGHLSKSELRAVSIMNARMKKYITVHQRAIPLDKILLLPIEVAQVHEQSDKLFARLDVNKDGEVSQEEFIRLANSDPDLKRELSQLLIKEEGVKMISAVKGKKK
eukprot:TRINITY_DN73_c0_g1_i3.p1 TRINITY_DN73_c0_g1~~TRINITY_DN73_c0_g1_i3.p1  ORF type:complete len:233 (-),score=77.70 TRINITY_DN73_c0_g1_i3:104-745(-)